MVDTNNFAYDFIVYRFYGFYRFAIVVGWVFVIQYVFNVFAGAFTRYFYQFQRRKIINVGFYSVFV